MALHEDGQNIMELSYARAARELSSQYSAAYDGHKINCVGTAAQRDCLTERKQC